MIAFSAAYPGEREQIYLMDDDGGNLTCLTARHALSSYRKLWWLPDQQHLLFASFSPYQCYYTIDRIGEQLRPFIPELGPGMIRQVTASGHIVFGAQGKGWIVPPHGTARDCVEIEEPGDFVTLSPDGNWAVFRQDDTPESVYLRERATGATRSVVLSDPKDEHYADTYSVVWSPDGQYLAYVADYTELWIRHVQHHERHNIGDVAYFWLRWCWSPDSARIIFIRSADPDGPAPSEAHLSISEIAAAQTWQLVDLVKEQGNRCYLGMAVARAAARVLDLCRHHNPHVCR